MVDPALISNRNIDLNSSMEYQLSDMELLKVAENKILYKPNAAMNEVVFEDKKKFMDYLRTTMLQAAKNMEFEEAARIRDQIARLENELN